MLRSCSFCFSASIMFSMELDLIPWLYWFKASASEICSSSSWITRWLSKFFLRSSSISSLSFEISFSLWTHFSLSFCNSFSASSATFVISLFSDSVRYIFFSSILHFNEYSLWTVRSESRLTKACFSLSSFSSKVLSFSWRIPDNKLLFSLIHSNSFSTPSSFSLVSFSSSLIFLISVSFFCNASSFWTILFWSSTILCSLLSFLCLSAFSFPLISS